MQRPDELGQLKAGFLAGIVLVDGDPLQNLALLADPAKIRQEQGVREALAEMH